MAEKFEFLKFDDRNQPEVHVMPNDGSHNSSKYCWCSPTLNYKDSITHGEVWVHRRTDN